MATNDEDLKKRAKALKLNGLLAHWAEVSEAAWVRELIEWEEVARQQRSLDRRVKVSGRGTSYLAPTGSPGRSPAPGSHRTWRAVLPHHALQ